MSKLTSLERRALDAALQGDEPWRADLRKQIEQLDVVSREDTGAGTYTTFRLLPDAPVAAVPAGVERDPPTSWADHPGLPGPVSFLVWIQAGSIHELEMALTLGRTPIEDPEAFVFRATEASAD
jgi:hypothetical protein